MPRISLSAWYRGGCQGTFVSQKYTIKLLRKGTLEVLKHEDGHTWWFENDKHFARTIGVKPGDICGMVGGQPAEEEKDEDKSA